MNGTNWSTKAIYVVFLILTTSCGSNTEKSSTDLVTRELHYASTQYLIEPEELYEKLNSGSSLKLLDIRLPDVYKAGHIQNAVNLWRSQIEDSSFSYGGMMPTKFQLEQMLGTLGILPSDTIVIYDNKAEVDAARIWWILKFYGHQNMKLLNGGLRSWMLMDSTLAQASPNITSSTYVFENDIDSSIYASFQLVNSVTEDASFKLLDARGTDEYSGKTLKNGAAWPGYIPSAINLNWADAVNYEGNHKFLSAKELKSKYESIGIEQDNSVICYCHSGVRSAHTLFVLRELLGYKDVRNYDGSWTEWSHLNPEEDKKLP